MKIGDYDPVECLREEVKRFKDTNTFTPMLVTGFYLQAAIVLDEHKQLTESNRQLREEVRVLELKNRASLANNLCPDHRDKQAGKPCLACEIEQLREELEKVKAFAAEERDIVQRVWKALGKETFRECKPYTIWEWVESQRTALAAAKEALEANQRWLIKHTDIEGDVPLLEKYVNPALARIAECEKGT